MPKMICDTHPNNKKNNKKNWLDYYNFFPNLVSDKWAFH